MQYAGTLELASLGPTTLIFNFVNYVFNALSIATVRCGVPAQDYDVTLQKCPPFDGFDCIRGCKIALREAIISLEKQIKMTLAV